jgi:hypothetical protein
MLSPAEYEIRKLALTLAVQAMPPSHPPLGNDPILRRAAAFEDWLTRSSRVTAPNNPARDPQAGVRP